MGRRKRGRPRGAELRRKRAKNASDYLSKFLEKPWNHSSESVDAAAYQMWAVGRRHRIGLHPHQRSWICRHCKSLLRPGVTARVRIRNGVRITTCQRCGKICRRGPDFTGGAK